MHQILMNTACNSIHVCNSPTTSPLCLVGDIWRGLFATGCSSGKGEEAWLGVTRIFASQQSWPKINSALRMGIYMYLYWCNIERVWDAGNSYACGNYARSLSLCIQFHRLEQERDKKASFLFDRAFLRILSRPCFHTVHKCKNPQWVEITPPPIPLVLIKREVVRRVSALY